MSDRTPATLADAIADAVDLLERSLDVLRRQGEQLDTLRAEVERVRVEMIEPLMVPVEDHDPTLAHRLARASAALYVATVAAAAVPQDPEEGRA